MRPRKRIEGELLFCSSKKIEKIQAELLLDIRELLLKACAAQGVQARAVETISQQKLERYKRLFPREWP